MTIGVVALRHELQQLQELIDSLAPVDPREAEILIVANEFDPPAGMHASVRIIKESRRLSLAAARNRIIERAIGAWILFTDSDCIADRQLWQNAISVGQRAQPQVAAIQAQIDGSAQTGIAHWEQILDLHALFARRNGRHVAWHEEPVELQPGGPKEILCLHNTFMVRRRSAMVCGGFNECLGGGSDRDLAASILECGGKIVFEPALRVVHRSSYTVWSVLARKWRHGRGRAINAIVHSKTFRSPLQDMDTLGQMLRPPPYLAGPSWRIYYALTVALSRLSASGHYLYFRLIRKRFNGNYPFRRHREL
ncbi:glycosyltransferase [Candidatus Competibacter phosphatis]|uniref:glycosyltransferase n=1 Tax=Candidatus Competibacter phosphatis TaxID=221280 RepID=UPI00145E369F|nr:glycosyltransferase [Candidatus Competibacter phosphatis]